jgi:hypothetical protein
VIGGRLRSSLHAGVLFAALGLVTWASGQPFVFPSLGPSAFVLAVERRSESTRPARVVGGHLIGGVAGLLTYTALGAGTTLTTLPAALSAPGTHLVGSGICSVVLTT